MADIRFRPLDSYPGSEAKVRQRSRFRACYRTTLRDLEIEIAALGAREVVIEAGFRASDIRIDGWPRLGSTPRHPGVAVHLYGCKGSQDLAFDCDRFDDWEDNLRAIALSLQALRAVERFGVTTGRQYAAFKALPAPEGAETAPQELRPIDAAEIVARIAGGTRAGFVAAIVARYPEAYRLAWQSASRKAHPDHGGTPEDFRELTRAKRVLDRTHALQETPA